MPSSGPPRFPAPPGSPPAPADEASRPPADPAAADAGVLARFAAATVSVLAAPTLAEMLDRVAAEGRALLGARQAVCSLITTGAGAHDGLGVSPAGEDANWRPVAGAPEDLATSSLARETGRPVRLTRSELEAHPRWRGVGPEAGDQPPLRGLLAVPLPGRDGGCSGLLQLSDKADGTDFDGIDEAVALQFARVAGLALENAGLAAAARDGEERRRAMVEQLPAVVYVLDPDPDRPPVYLSPRWADLLGVPVDEMPARGPAWNDRVHPDDLPRVCAEDERTANTGEPFRADYRLRRGDGTWVWVRDEAVPVRDEAGRIVASQGILFDISAEKRTEDALRASEEHLRLALDAARMASWDRDVGEGTVVRSPGMPALFGLTPEEAAGGRGAYLARIHPDDRAALAASDRDREAGGPYEIAYRVVWPGGEERWLRDRGEVLLGRDGAPVRYLGVTQDVTGQKRAEADLRAARDAAEGAERRTRDILDQLADGFVSLDHDGRFLHLNAAAARLLRRPVGDLLGRGIWREFAPAIGTGFERAVRRVMDEGVAASVVEYYAPLEAWIEARVYPAPGGASVFVRDVSEAKRADAALREHADRLAAIVAVQEAVAAARPDPDAVMRLVVERARELSGAAGAGLASIEDGHVVYRAGAGFAAGLVGVAYAIEGSLAGRCLRTGEIVSSDDALADPRADWPLARQFGIRSVLLVPLNHEGRTVGVLSLLSPQAAAFGERDAHLLRLMAGLVGSSLAHAAAFAALEEASRLKSAFLSTMSHELRTPLNAIVGYAHLLLDGMAGPLEEAQAGDVGEIAGAADRLLALVDDVLDLSRIEAGALALDPEPIDLARVLRHVRADVAPQAAARGLVLAFAADPGLGLVADPHRLRQVLLNLVGNAVKFTAAGGIDVRARAADGGVEIAVRDTGIGIAPDVLPHVFDEFRQADGSTTRRYGGSGLGLAIARRLVELHGGSLRAESALGVGSTFTVWLPAAPVADSGGAAADQPGPVG